MNNNTNSFSLVYLLEQYADAVIIGAAVLVALCLLMFILLIVNMVQTSKLKKKYKTFMAGKDGVALDKIIAERLDTIEGLVASTTTNKNNIDKLVDQIQYSFQKIGLVKYDAFDEMGGKLSFSLCLLNEKEDGFIINAMHSREGCYTYIKEIIAGKSVIILSGEEKEALEMAKSYR